MKPPIQVVPITTRRPRGDMGECAYVHFTAADGMVRVVDPEGCLLRYSNGEPVSQLLGPEDNPRQVAARLGRSYHNQVYGDSERGFWRDLPGKRDVPV